MIARLLPRGGADGGWCRRRSSKPFRGAYRVPGGFDSHTLPSFPLGLLAALILVAAPAPLVAQEDAPPAEPAEPSPDTAAVVDSVSPVVRTPRADTLDVPEGPAPMSAFFRSVLVPGWGQLAADQPVRAAFYFTMQTATVFMVFRTQDRIDDAESDALKEARREQREDWLVLAGFWALAAGVDAWVSAQLWDFEGEVVPPPDGSDGVALRLSFPTRGF